MSAPTRFSRAVSEGDGIALIARVASEDEARRAESDGAEALLVQRGGQEVLDAVRAASTVPVLVHWERERARPDGADACVVDARGERDRDWLQHVQDQAAGDHEIALRVGDEEHLELALEEFDPQIVILAAPGAEGEEALEAVLDLLPDVPAGKLAIADLAASAPDEITALERAGVDGVIVDANRVGALVGDDPPDV